MKKLKGSRFDAVQGAIEAAREDFQLYTDYDRYSPGHYAIVQALLIVASEIAQLHDLAADIWQEGKSK